MHQHPTATQGDRRSPEDGFGGGGGRGGGQGAWLATRRRSFHHRPPSHLSWPPSRRCRETWGQGAGSAGARTLHRRAPIPSSLLSPRPLAQHRRRPRLDVRRGAHGEEDDGEESVEVKEGGHGVRVVRWWLWRRAVPRGAERARAAARAPRSSARNPHADADPLSPFSPPQIKPPRVQMS